MPLLAKKTSKIIKDHRSRRWNQLVVSFPPPQQLPGLGLPTCFTRSAFKRAAVLELKYFTYLLPNWRAGQNWWLPSLTATFCFILECSANITTSSSLQRSLFSAAVIPLSWTAIVALCPAAFWGTVCLQRSITNSQLKVFYYQPLQHFPLVFHSNLCWCRVFHWLEAYIQYMCLIGLWICVV